MNAGCWIPLSRFSPGAMDNSIEFMENPQVLTGQVYGKPGYAYGEVGGRRGISTGGFGRYLYIVMVQRMFIYSGLIHSGLGQHRFGLCARGSSVLGAPLCSGLLCAWGSF